MRRNGTKINPRKSLRRAVLAKRARDRRETCRVCGNTFDPKTPELVPCRDGHAHVPRRD